MSADKGLLAVVLAAGLGKRMNSETPKVLHHVCGRPMILYALEAAELANPAAVLVVVGHGAEMMEVTMEGSSVELVVQDPQLGTGDAVRVAMDKMGADFEEIMVLPGDSPLITGETLSSLVETRRAQGAAASIMVTEMDDPTGYGRVIRDSEGRVVGVVEEADCDEKTRAIREVNACTYVFDAKRLLEALGGLGRDNAQEEYYLVDVISLLHSVGEETTPVSCDSEEAMGINDREQLARVNGIMRRRINQELMLSGVTMIDPGAVYVDWGVEVERDVVLFPSVFITGRTHIGPGAKLGPFVSIKDSQVGSGARIQFSWLEECEVAQQAQVGPFARVRPGTRVGEGSKVGTFVEMKNTSLGKDSKVPHLSYIGDAEIGEGVNVGAGSITCNYDGQQKHLTVIEDGAFLGSDTMMVAPVRIGKNATTGAGSVIYKDIPDGALGIERTEQKNVPDYRKGRESESTEE